MRRPVTRSAALVLVLVLASCGGGSSDSTEEFLDELNDICRDITRDIDDIDADSLSDGAEEAKDILDDGLERMDELDAPDELSDEYDDLVAIVEDTQDAFDDLGDAADASDQAAIDAASADLTELLQDRSDVAEAMGADKCISDDSEQASTTVPGTAPDDTAAPGDTATPPSTGAPSTSVPVTAPPISQVPITSPTSVVVDPASIGTIDVAGGYVAPRGYTMSDPGEDELNTLKQAMAQSSALATSVESVGGAYMVDSAGIVVAELLLTFWNDDIEGTALEQAYTAEITSLADSTDVGVTPRGLTHTTYSEPDGTVGLIATSGAVSVWILSQAPFEDQLPAILDRFVRANG